MAPHSITSKRDMEMVDPITEGLYTKQRALAYRHARSRGLTHEEAQDLAQTSLIDAVRSFNPSLGAKFSTFAYRVYMADLNSFLKKKYRTLDPAMSGSELNRKFEGDVTQVVYYRPRKRTGREDLSNIEIATQYIRDNMPGTEIAEGMNAHHNTIYKRLEKMGIDRIRPRRPPKVELSEIQIQVLSHSAAGLVAKEISMAMGVTTRAVNWHSVEIARKLGVRTLAGAVNEAWKRGILKNEDAG